MKKQQEFVVRSFQCDPKKLVGAFIRAMADEVNRKKGYEYVTIVEKPSD